MPIIRNKLSSVTAGGPRQYAEIQDRMLVSVGSRDNISEAKSELTDFRLRAKSLKNAPVMILEPENTFEDVLDRARELGRDDSKVRNGIDEVSSVEDAGDEVKEVTSSILAATGNLMQQIQLVSVVDVANFVTTQADFGPENLRIDIQDQSDMFLSEAKQKENNMEEVYSKLGLPEAWETTRGENAIVAIFDTAFAENLISDDRMVDTFHGADTDSAYAPEEGHGTMCAGAAAANKNEGVPFNGSAPEAGVILVRITDSEGQIRSDVISEAWDWLADQDYDRPVIANHSYGTPLCSGRPRSQHCNTALNDVIKRVTQDKGITAVYAAGNEAMRCGHRPSGVTNAITGTNSLPDIITVGALLSGGNEVQRYSSHGRGDCAPVADPKPNVCCRLPMYTYYGDEEGWKIKDMTTGPYGSGGGTSHASPTTTGMLALLQSKAYEDENEDDILQTEEIKQIIHNTAEAPHRTQINMFGFLISEKGYDARFGHGEMRINKALKEV